LKAKAEDALLIRKDEKIKERKNKKI